MLSPDFIYATLSSVGNQVFYVEFIKRSDGSLRKMTCRLHVTKGVKGVLPPGQRKREDDANACLTVYEIPSGAFKRIPLDSVVRLHVDGHQYVNESVR